MRRRRFIAGLLGISVLALAPSAAWTQQSSRLRRITVLMLYPEKDPEGQARARAFREGFESLGWTPARTSRSISSGACSIPIGRVS